MSNILTQWLVQDLKMAEVKDLDQDFSSGYLFGKVLAKLNLIDDFEGKFVNSKQIDALIKNFTSLEDALRQKLDFRLTSNMADDLIHEKIGSTAQLLFQIKSLSDTKQKIMRFKKVPKKSKLESYPSSPVGMILLLQ